MVKNSLRLSLAFSILLAMAGQVNAQLASDRSPASYPFIRYTDNFINFLGDTLRWNSLVNSNGTLKGSIVHLGGSHIQADIYTHQIRQRHAALHQLMPVSRGFVFPFSVAGSHDPATIRVTSEGHWASCRLLANQPPCMAGIAGIALETSDPKASINITIASDTGCPMPFDRLKVFHRGTSDEFTLKDPEGIVGRRNDTLGFTEFCFNQSINSFQLAFAPNDTAQKRFVLYGLSFETVYPGFTYHAVGLNGSTLETFLNNPLFGRYLAALDPSLVILSIGTNDGSKDDFDRAHFYFNYAALVQQIRASVPDAAILLTVPNDSYLHRKVVNLNIPLVHQAIIDLAREEGLAVWDFFTIMGGLGSSKDWYAAGLMRPDRVHFSRKGYVIKGDLLFEALTPWLKGNQYTQGSGD